MIPHADAAYVGWAAVALGVVSTRVQVRRIERVGHEGVSLGTWLLFLWMGAFWITYGVAQRSFEIVAGSLLVLPWQVKLVWRLQPWEQPLVVAKSAFFTIVSCAVPIYFLGWSGGVYGSGLAMTVNRLPQLVELVTTTAAAGVSPVSWFVAVAGSLLWITYYSSSHLLAALIATSFAGAANLAIALLSTWRHAGVRRLERSGVASD